MHISYSTQPAQPRDSQAQGNGSERGVKRLKNGWKGAGKRLRARRDRSRVIVTPGVKCRLGKAVAHRAPRRLSLWSRASPRRAPVTCRTACLPLRNNIRTAICWNTPREQSKEHNACFKPAGQSSVGMNYSRFSAVFRSCTQCR